jgi:hypothetical protein
MAWKVLQTNLSGLEDEAPSIAMDSNGYPNCVWLEGSSLKFARFRGDAWEYINGDPSILVSSGTLSLAKNCIAFDELNDPHILFRENNDLVHLHWDGYSWTRLVVLSDPDLMGWSATYFSDPYAMTLSRNGSSSVVKMHKLESGSWVFKAGQTMPIQEEEDPQIVAKPVSSSIYAFWRNKSGGEAWLNHLIYRTGTSSWFGYTDFKVWDSKVSGEITGLDFVSKAEVGDCPNFISSIVATVRSDLSFTFDKWLNIGANLIPGSYLQLYSASASGSSHDPDNIFWGDTSDTSTKVADGYISLVINGTTYYLPKYRGATYTGCSTWLSGTASSSGNFTFYGYALILVNRTELRWTPIYINCPNVVSSIVATVRSDLTFTFDKWLGVEGDSSPGYYLQLYSAPTSGSSYDSSNVFWGNALDTSAKTASGYMSIVVNGNTYYMPKYDGDAVTGCTTSLTGTEELSGTFTFYGYALIWVNATELKWTPLYEMS